MKALITAFALLSFVAASTIPVVAQAQTQSEQPVKKKAKKKKPAKKASAKKKSGKKVKKANQA